jgi:HSP20 family molecular chaperone IbpA
MANVDCALNNCESMGYGFPDLRVSSSLEIEVKERLHSVQVSVSLPGIRQDDLEVYVLGHTLLILEKQKIREKLSRVTSFEQTVELPCQVSATGADLTFKDSVLHVLLLKRYVFERPRDSGAMSLQIQ